MPRVALVQVRAESSYGRFEAAGPPLGLLSLVSYARQERPGRDDFRVWDCHFFNLLALARRVVSYEPDLVGLSAANMIADATRAFVSALRQAGLRCPLVIGGPLATSNPDWCLALDGVHGVVRGEGEGSFVALLEALDCGKSLFSTPGLSVRTAVGRQDNPCDVRLDDLNELDPPAYDLIDFDLYQWSASQGARFCLPPHRWAPLFTSRSCPYQCTFCHPIFGKGFRAQSAARIVETVEQLYERYGVQNFHIYDDIFNLDRRRMLDFSRRMVRSRVPARFYFVNGLRADRMNRGDVEALAEAGTVFMSVAIETASPRLQREIKKYIDVDKVLRTVDWANDFGIFVNGFFVVGFPGEGRDELEATFTAAALSHLHHAWFFSFIPSAGTEVGDTLVASGVDLDPERTSSYLSLPWSVRNLTAMTQEEFSQTVRHGLRRFWTPWRFASFARHYPNIDEALLFASDRRTPLLMFEYARMRLLETNELLIGTRPRREPPKGWRPKAARLMAPLIRKGAKHLLRVFPCPEGRDALPPEARGFVRHGCEQDPDGPDGL